MNETKSYIFEYINHIDKSLTRVTKIKNKEHWLLTSEMKEEPSLQLHGQENGKELYKKFLPTNLITYMKVTSP